MSSACNNYNPSSQYHPFCCVHNNGPENQPLLGYHSHQHQHQGEYRVDMSNEKSGIPPHAEACTSNCKRSRRRKFLGRNEYHRGYSLDSDSHKGVGSTSTYDLCRDNAIDWDGPSQFETTAENIKLGFGKGNFKPHVRIHAGPVTKPTLRITGKVSPAEQDDVDETNNNNDAVPNGDVVIEFERLGVHIDIKTSADLFEAFIWFEDRTITDGRNRYAACAILEISIILPESYTRYNSITVDGVVALVEAYDLETIAFNKLNLATSTGKISTRGDVFVDELLSYVKTGKTEIESVQVTKGSEKPLNVRVSANTGHIAVGVKATPVSKDEKEHHNIDISTRTGSVVVNVTPSLPTDSSKKPGDLDVKTRSETGSIKSTIQLASAEQKLYFISSSNTGAVEALVSDAFLGHFNVETRVGSAKVQEASNSESRISYEKQTSQIKAGVKTLTGDDGRGDQSRIDLRTITGRTYLTFTN
ncbi:hypothetical protein BGX20_008614 [Mortierella sp. AD010]|nr:hypothetical protein BGX20_008614 [Mortierella sp. AD010]